MPGKAEHPRYRMLGVFAHPDDESFGMGGTIAKYAAQGQAFGIVTFTRGERSTAGTSLQHTPQELAATRVAELERAVSILGGSLFRVHGYPDSGLANIPQGELVEQVISAVREFRPHVIFTFDGGGISGHPDHVAASTATTTGFHSTAPAGLTASYEGPLRLYYVAVPERITIPLSQTFGVRMAGVPEERLTCAIDVSEYLLVQLSAVSAHATQSSPLPRLWQARVAAQNGLEYFSLSASVIPHDRPGAHNLLDGLPAL
jgi:N-acetylglucosamine malate deacetylase 2